MEFFNITNVLVIVVYLLYGTRIACLSNNRKGGISAGRWLVITILWLPLCILGIADWIIKKLVRIF